MMPLVQTTRFPSSIGANLETLRFHHENGVFPNFLNSKSCRQNMGQPLTHTLTHMRNNSYGTNGIRQSNPTGFCFFADFTLFTNNLSLFTAAQILTVIMR